MHTDTHAHFTICKAYILMVTEQNACEACFMLLCAPRNNICYWFWGDYPADDLFTNTRKMHFKSYGVRRDLCYIACAIQVRKVREVY